MVFLPRFLYLFQHIPIFIKKSFFQYLDQMVSSFLWANKPQRIGKAVLRLPKKSGGLALPNLIQYYWACSIDKIRFWMDSGDESRPSWAQLELLSSKLSLQSLLTAQLPLKIHNISHNPVVLNSLRFGCNFANILDSINPQLWPQFSEITCSPPPPPTPPFVLGVTKACSTSKTFIREEFSLISQSYQSGWTCPTRTSSVSSKLDISLRLNIPIFPTIHLDL